MKLVLGFILYQDSTLKYLEYFLPSLKKALQDFDSNSYQVIAFDNSAKNDNRNRLALEFFNHKNNFSIQYLSQGENLGFAKAYNIMITRAFKLEAEYFLVINPDVIIAQEAINLLVKNLDQDQNISALSPKILRWNLQEEQIFNGQSSDFLNLSNVIDTCGLKKKAGALFYDLGQGEEDRGQFDQEKIIAPSGAAGLFRMSALNKVSFADNYFDDRFFMYKEDCDLAYRFHLLGLKSKLIPEALIYHHRTMAKNSDSNLGFWQNRRQMSKTLRAWSFRNQYLLFVKYFRYESFWGKIIIIQRSLALFLFSLIFEQFSLKEYKNLIKLLKNNKKT